MKIGTQRAFDGHTLTHEIWDDYVRTVLTDRDGWFVMQAECRITVGAADTVCNNNDAIYATMGWDGE